MKTSTKSLRNSGAAGAFENIIPAPIIAVYAYQRFNVLSGYSGTCAAGQGFHVAAVNSPWTPMRGRPRSATSQPVPPVAMPTFSFDPIEVRPASPVAGQAFAVSMKVTNTGQAAGTYKADLIINGKNADNRALYLDPYKSDSVTFQVNLPIPGQYVVKIGPQSKEIIVGFNRVPVTIRIDWAMWMVRSTVRQHRSTRHMIQMVEATCSNLQHPSPAWR
jgi:hypothetical protein